jgi:SAM-dependent methyltransferase
MDYRKPALFGENWSASRYKVLPYFAEEKALLLRSDVERVLDVGCANGWNMSRFNQYGRDSVGLDTVFERVALARQHGPVLLASGLEVPIAPQSVDVVYIQHVLHHIGDVEKALFEAWRVLKPGGHLFLIETVEDSPLIRWGRRFHPYWMGDSVNAPFRFQSLQRTVEEAGFDVDKAQQYSVLFWIWEILPDQIPWMEKLTPLFVTIEQIVARYFRKYGAHCYLLASKPDDGGGF